MIRMQKGDFIKMVCDSKPNRRVGCVTRIPPVMWVVLIRLKDE